MTSGTSFLFKQLLGNLQEICMSDSKCRFSSCKTFSKELFHKEDVSILKGLVVNNFPYNSEMFCCSENSKEENFD